MDAAQYVDEILEADRNDTIERVEWISDHRPEFSADTEIPSDEGLSVIFNDLQMCYIYGIYTGAIFLGQSFIKQSVRTLASRAGEFTQKDELGYHEAQKFLEENDILSPEDVEGVPLNKLHEVRNPLAHNQIPKDKNGISNIKVKNICGTSMLASPTSHGMLEDDARKTLKTCFSVSRQFGFKIEQSKQK